MTRILTCLAMTIVSLSLSGCSGVMTSKAPPATIYTLHAASAAPAPEQAPGQARPVLSVPTPAVPPGFDTPQIALYLNDGRQLDYYAGAQWPSTLGALLQDVVIETGRDTLNNATISEPDLNLPAAWKLVIKVVDFQPVYHNAADSNPDLVVSLNFKLIRYPEENVVLDFTLGRTAPGVSNSLTTVTGGLENALQIILAEAFTDIDREIAISP